MDQAKALDVLHSRGHLKVDTIKQPLHQTISWKTFYYLIGFVWKFKHTELETYLEHEIIIIIIKRRLQCKTGGERFTPYQSEDPNPTVPT